MDEEIQKSESPDIPTGELVKKFKKRYPILFTIIAIISIFIGAGLTGGITKLISYFKDNTPESS